MTIKFLESFRTFIDNDTDLQAAGYLLTNTAAISISTTTPRFSPGAYLATGANGTVKYTFPATSDNVSVGTAFRYSGAPAATGSAIARFESAAAATIVQIGVDSLGAIRVGRGDFTTNLIAQSANGVVAATTWQYIEVELVRHASAGEVRVWVNGVSVINVTAVNTGATILGIFSFLSGISIFFTDFYYGDAATNHVGEVRVEDLVPSADTADADFTRSTGTNGSALVDELPENGDTDYVASATVGHLDLYELSNLSSLPTSIFAVQTEMWARKDDATVRQVRNVLKSGSTISNGATRSLSTSYVPYRDLYLTDPDTAAAWTAAKVNSLQVGPEVVS